MLAVSVEGEEPLMPLILPTMGHNCHLLAAFRKPELMASFGQMVANYFFSLTSILGCATLLLCAEALLGLDRADENP